MLLSVPVQNIKGAKSVTEIESLLDSHNEMFRKMNNYLVKIDQFWSWYHGSHR